MGLFDKLRENLEDVEEEAEDAAVSTEELRKSDEELEAELEAELSELDQESPSTKPPSEEADGQESPSQDAPSQDAAAQEAAAETVDEPPASTTPSDTGLEAETVEATAEPEEAEASTGVGGYQIDPERVEDLLWDLELVLLEADVAADVAHELRDIMEKRLGEIRVESKSQVPEAIETELRRAIRSVLEGGSFDFDGWVLENVDEAPLSIMFVGVNGTGKTTTIARVAHRMKELGFGVVLAAGDTYRAGAIEQLEEHGDNLGLRTIKHSAGSDPAAVCYDALDHAEARRKEIVLIDTAGRMQTDENLMDELEKIGRVAEPDLTVFVGDSLAGNDAIEQAREFDASVDVDACVLTKVDTDAKGGAALSIARAVGKPVAFLGVGEGYDDLIPFDADWLIERIFGE